MVIYTCHQHVEERQSKSKLHRNRHPKGARESDVFCSHVVLSAFS